MATSSENKLLYQIFDPTGNITALVESEVAIDRQPEVAASIMGRHPEVEQVGFVTLGTGGDARVRASLRMAGGEFCGNASMCAAAWQSLKSGHEPTREEKVWLRVSGAHEPVEVRLLQEEGNFHAGIHMPNVLGISQIRLSFDGESDSVTLVRMEGISHIVIEPASVFHTLLERRDNAARAVKTWCKELDADGLGLMFVGEQADPLCLDPLVFVRSGETLFWENSCASGSSAVGMYLAQKVGRPIDLLLKEPGGTLRVTSDPAAKVTWLYGSVVPASELLAL